MLLRLHMQQPDEVRRQLAHATVAEPHQTRCGMGYVASHNAGTKGESHCGFSGHSATAYSTVSTSSLVRVSGTEPMTSSAQLDRSVRRYSSMYLSNDRVPTYGGTAVPADTVQHRYDGTRPVLYR